MIKSDEENENINNPCLYIYGAPGTGQYEVSFFRNNFDFLSLGKTAVVTSVTSGLSEQGYFKVMFLNCMSMQVVRDVLEHLLEQLNCKTKITAKNMWSLSMSYIDKCRLPV